ncbi:MAG: phosphoribosyl-AMP cyclohydrolase, partial [Halobacteriaceae archaeon]
MSEDRVEMDFSSGPIPTIAQDVESGDVLMLAYATREALDRSVETGKAHYHSRSRDELWKKGETSGNVQHIEEIRVDCDGDALLYIVSQDGGACHTGFRSCFHRKLSNIDANDGVTVEISGNQVFDPEDV